MKANYSITKLTAHLSSNLHKCTSIELIRTKTKSLFLQKRQMHEHKFGPQINLENLTSNFITLDTSQQNHLESNLCILLDTSHINLSLYKLNLHTKMFLINKKQIAKLLFDIYKINFNLRIQKKLH